MHSDVIFHCLFHKIQIFTNPYYSPLSAQPCVLALQGRESIKHIQDHRDTGQVDTNIATQAHDGAEARYASDIEEHLGAGSFIWLEQTAFDEPLDQRRMQAGAGGQCVESYLLTLDPARDDLVASLTHR
jgi:hypothetical protein